MWECLPQARLGVPAITGDILSLEGARGKKVAAAILARNELKTLSFPRNVELL